MCICGSFLWEKCIGGRRVSSPKRFSRHNFCFLSEGKREKKTENAFPANDFSGVPAPAEAKVPVFGAKTLFSSRNAFSARKLVPCLPRGKVRSFGPKTLFALYPAPGRVGGRGGGQGTKFQPWGANAVRKERKKPFPPQKPYVPCPCLPGLGARGGGQGRGQGMEIILVKSH